MVDLLHSKHKHNGAAAHRFLLVLGAPLDARQLRGFRRENKQMFFGVFSDVVVKLGMGILCNHLLIAILIYIQQLSLRVLDAMLELFKRVIELYTYGCISL